MSTTFDLGSEQARVDVLRQLESQLVAEGRWAAGPFTMFEVLGLTRHELANCRMLGWLLDPLAPHGLGTRSLQRFLAHLNELAGEDRLPTEATVARTTIVREEARSSTRADLILYGVGWTVVIEAKVGAGEQPEQGREAR
jgi:hypothetical protein